MLPSVVPLCGKCQPSLGSEAPPLMPQQLRKLERGQRVSGKALPGLLWQKGFFFKILTAAKVRARAVGLRGNLHCLDLLVCTICLAVTAGCLVEG